MKEIGRHIKQEKSLNKAESLSADENLVELKVSLSNVATAYAYIGSVAGFYGLLTLTNCNAEGSSGQDSDHWSVFELRCEVPTTFSINSFFQ